MTTKEVIGDESPLPDNSGDNKDVNVSMYKDVMTIDIKNLKSVYIKLNGFTYHIYSGDEGYADITVWTSDKDGEINIGLPKGYKKNIRRF